MEDYYSILKIRRNASASEIKKAYRKQAMLFHPDVNRSAGASNTFALINQAYKTLSDYNRKRKYDVLLHYGFNATSANKPKPESKYDADKGRKYGTAYKYQSTRTAKTETFSKADQQQISLFEDILFYSLLFIGVFGFFLAVRDLAYNEWDGINSLTGLIFSISFVSLLLYFWTLFKKRE